eukprot:TRINITY_DN3529_c0_g2_i16.p2 TRINITY_DN3529_c0_g2~~TRINITY_DN3529_c0_g2_i16.p2  ORF type:complete len:198 (-),score=77.35 TRINITY_DN3529_c0_g2_i16:1383-1976(-)
MEGDDAWEVVNEHGESGQGAGGGESTAVAVAVAGRRRQHVPEIQPSLEVLEAEQEMRELEAMMERWRVPNTHKPFAKNVVCMLGTTSSGKSSFVNHFFGVGVKKTAMCQLDTHFTLVEVIPEEDFAKLVGATYKRKDISAAELKDSSLEQVADRRYVGPHTLCSADKCASCCMCNIVFSLSHTHDFYLSHAARAGSQ